MLYLRLDLQSFRDDRTVIYWCGGTNLPDSRHAGKSKKKKLPLKNYRNTQPCHRKNNSKQFQYLLLHAISQHREGYYLEVAL